ncbi:Serine/threonine protein kinase [Hyella patelloides LEGE 07179]|uniref:non-specific serine/threonine protein kinase n=1 Tax=Hyella patelloides LEGE 07179 TaxID=945734 RepID=A0A563W0Z7_9CYAN|nr:protein kinase [Hyella patelloides]VEP17315.1 Serine/threonine protein kinase [Hyella patelloides LEGE 07179]
MNNIPDLTQYGYKIIEKLGQDKNKSNIIWQGITTNNNISVIIKQFCFATKDSSWSGYQTYQREIELLKTLKHPGIPRYLDSFETDNSFCFVREYIEGVSLAEFIETTEKNLKIIAVKILDILVYLQQQKPPVLHLGITPNNIIVDEQKNVYLTDFSLAQNTNNTVDFSLIKTSNAEFIAPEQLNAPCKASDIYGLGVTLNRLIKKQQSLSLVTNNKLDASTLSELDSGFQEWLNTMVEPELNKRYPDAETAKKALQTSSWDAIEPVVKSNDNVVLSNRAFATGLVTMIVLGSAIALGFNVTQKATEKSLINITIALMGMVIIYLTQSASATIITNDNSEKKQGIIVAISVPIILAIITGFIFGKGEAVAMGLATIIAQTATLGYVLLQKLPLSQQDNTLRVIGLVIAIALGLICGVVIF